jgi:hypothetical protein
VHSMSVSRVISRAKWSVKLTVFFFTTVCLGLIYCTNSAGEPASGTCGGIGSYVCLLESFPIPFSDLLNFQRDVDTVKIPIYLEILILNYKLMPSMPLVPQVRIDI